MTYESLGNCYLAYQAETPAQYRARTGEYMGGNEPGVIGLITLHFDGKPMGVFQDLATARLHMQGIASVATSLPIMQA
jgi:hypothetical protein